MRGRHLIFILLGLLMLSCKVQYVPVEHTEYVHTIDSVYFRDTTIQYRIEKEYVRDYTWLLDTLEMETSYSSFAAWVDTSAAKLSGIARNKEKIVDIPVSVKEKVTVRDSIVYQDRPVPVEVVVTKTKYPAVFWWLLGWCILSIGYIAVKVYFKMRIAK